MTRRATPVHANFQAAFTRGHVFHSENGDIPMRQIVAGNLVAPSGRIIACDPMFLSTRKKPFRRVAPAGTHPVVVAIANLWRRDERVACARIKFGPSEPVRWQLATTAGQKLSALGPNQMYGFGVDSGTGCYIDAAALNAENYQFERGADRKLQKAREQYPSKGGFCGVIPVGRWGGPTLVGFSTGLGDGCYPSFWGIDGTGRIVTLDTDFGLLVEGIEAEVVFEGVMQRLNEVLQDGQMKQAGFGLRVRKRRHQTMPLVVDEIGGPCNLELFLLTESEEVFYRQYAGRGRDGTYAFEIDSKRLTRATALRLTFTKGFRPL